MCEGCKRWGHGLKKCRHCKWPAGCMYLQKGCTPMLDDDPIPEIEWGCVHQDKPDVYPPRNRINQYG